MISIPEAALLALVLTSACVTIFLRDVLATVIAFGSYSLGLALLWLTLQAPDVALTEAAVGAGVMTVLLLLTLTKTVRPSIDTLTFKSVNWPAAAVSLLFAGALLWTVPAMPEIGAESVSWSNAEVTQYYLTDAYDDTGVKNAVTAVLAAYRGFDTFGEAVVVFAAGVSVLVVIREEQFT